MLFNNHSFLADKHSFLSPSGYHWINYDDEKLQSKFLNHKAAERGTRLHNLAKEMIELRIQPENSGQTLNQYVRDAIGWGMDPEVVLFYSENCFGTADAISFDPKKRLLRISDLKTGVTPASMKQLYVYAAIFCLEYKYKPVDLSFEFRIYQNDEIDLITDVDPLDVSYIMDRIVHFDKMLKKWKEDTAL